MTNDFLIIDRSKQNRLAGVECFVVAFILFQGLIAWIGCVTTLAQEQSTKSQLPTSNQIIKSNESDEQTAIASMIRVDLMDGESRTGQLIRIESDKIRFQSSTQIEFSFVEVLQMEVVAKGDTGSTGASVGTAKTAGLITLLDGSQIQGNDIDYRDGIVSFRSNDGNEMKIGSKSVEAIRLDLAPEWDAAWSAVRREKYEGDGIVVKKEKLDVLEGVVNEINDETVKFKYDDAVLPVKRERLAGIIFYHANEFKAVAPVCKIVTRTGDQYSAKKIAFADSMFDIDLMQGESIRVPLSSVKNLNFALGRVHYLDSDVPTAISWQPMLGAGRLTKDLDLLFQSEQKVKTTQGALRLYREAGFDSQDASSTLRPKVKSFPHGLVLRSGTRVSFALPEGFQRLKGIAGIDPAVRPLGEVQLRISADGKDLVSQVVSGTDDAPFEIDQAINGVSRLVIEVDFGKQAHLADHLHLCDLKLTK
jgi:NPCBM/NEW2 domain